jgi:hypothetical protein
MASVFATAVIGGLMELFLKFKRPNEDARLLNSEDLEFKMYMTSFGKSYKQDDIYEIHKKEFLKTR